MTAESLFEEFLEWSRKRLGYQALSPDEMQGIFLDPCAPHWVLSKVRQRQFGAFLHALSDLVPAESVLCLEGGSPDEEIRTFFENRRFEHPVQIEKGISWPKPECYHMPITRENIEGLALLTERHAFPEIAIHIHVYHGEKSLLEWHDIFSRSFYASKDIPEERIREFCKVLGNKYRESDAS